MTNLHRTSFNERKAIVKKIILGLCTMGAVLAVQPANAHGNITCSVPRAEKQPSVKLQKDLKKAGWKITKIQTYNGCYEVYGRDEKGKKVEAFFDPRTLKRLDETNAG